MASPRWMFALLALSGCTASVHELSVHAITDCAGEDLKITKVSGQSWVATCHRRQYDTLYDCQAGDTAVVCRHRGQNEAGKQVLLPSAAAEPLNTDLDYAPRAGTTTGPQL